MAIYTKQKEKKGFITNRIRDVLIIGAFFLGYHSHDYLHGYVEKIKEYETVIENFSQETLDTILKGEKNE